MELKIKNFGHANGAEVRIIKVSDGAVFENLNAQFQQMDDLGMEHGIKIPAGLVISCDGASSIVGSVYLGPIEGEARTSIYLNERLIGIADENNWLDDLLADASNDELVVSAYFLNEWVPPAPPQN